MPMEQTLTYQKAANGNSFNANIVYRTPYFPVPTGYTVTWTNSANLNGLITADTASQAGSVRLVITTVGAVASDSWIELAIASNKALSPEISGSVGQSTIYSGTGAPPNTLGQNGDVYFRSDTPGVANQWLYKKSAGAWVGVL